MCQPLPPLPGGFQCKRKRPVKTQDKDTPPMTACPRRQLRAGPPNSALLKLGQWWVGPTGAPPGLGMNRRITPTPPPRFNWLRQIGVQSDNVVQIRNVVQIVLGCVRIRDVGQINSHMGKLRSYHSGRIEFKLNSARMENLPRITMTKPAKAVEKQTREKQ